MIKTLVKSMIPYSILMARRERIWKKQNIIQNGVLPHLGVLLTSACNLNCRHCADLIPYRRIAWYSSEEAISDLTKVLDSVSGIHELLLIGGEVMLYRELPSIMNFCVNQSKIKKIVVTTNGTVVPNEEVMTAMVHPKVSIRISGYGEHVSPRRKELIDVLNAKRINIEDLGGMIWKNIGLNHKRNHEEAVLEKIFHDCVMRYCVTMMPDGKIFFCSREVAAFYTSDYPTPRTNEYLDVRLYTADELKRKWYDFYNVKYISTCDYCDGISSHSPNVGTALQILSKKDYIDLLKIYLFSDIGHDVEAISDILLRNKKNLEDIDVQNSLFDAILGKNVTDVEEVRCLFADLLAVICEDYRFVIDTSDQFGSKQTYKAGGCFSEKNLVSILMSDDEDSCGKDYSRKFDLILNQEKFDAFAKLLHWKAY